MERHNLRCCFALLSATVFSEAIIKHKCISKINTKSGETGGPRKLTQISEQHRNCFFHLLAINFALVASPSIAGAIKHARRMQ